MERNLRFKIDWPNLIAGSKFTAFALFYFVFEGNIPSRSPWGAYIRRDDFTEGFFALPVWGGLYLEGLIHGGAYFRNFTAYKKYRIQSKGVKNALSSFWYTKHSGYFNDLFHF